MRGSAAAVICLAVTGWALSDANAQERASYTFYRNGVAVSVLEGEMLRPLTESSPEIATLLAGRKVPVTQGWVGRV